MNLQRQFWAGNISTASKGINYSISFKQTYDGNTDAVFAKTQVTSFHARFVRVIPTQWHYGMCMKVELRGCKGDNHVMTEFPFIVFFSWALLLIASELSNIWSNTMTRKLSNQTNMMHKLDPIIIYQI